MRKISARFAYATMAAMALVGCGGDGVSTKKDADVTVEYKMEVISGDVAVSQISYTNDNGFPALAFPSSFPWTQQIDTFGGQRLSLQVQGASTGAATVRLTITQYRDGDDLVQTADVAANGAFDKTIELTTE